MCYFCSKKSCDEPSSTEDTTTSETKSEKNNTDDESPVDAGATATPEPMKREAVVKKAPVELKVPTVKPSVRPQVRMLEGH